jgi:hypothetical protein
MPFPVLTASLERERSWTETAGAAWAGRGTGERAAPVAPPHPKEFQDLYDQTLQFSIPIAVLSVVGIQAADATGMLKETVRLLGARLFACVYTHTPTPRNPVLTQRSGKPCKETISHAKKRVSVQ